MNRIIEIQREAAYQAALLNSRLRDAIGRQVIGKRHGFRIGQIVTVQEDPLFERAVKDSEVDGGEPVTLGSYAVEVIRRIDRDTEETMWAALHDGVSDSMRWWTVDQALLMLIATRKGMADSRGAVVTFASRVIGFNDFPEG